ncbi:heme exporter protein CcmB [Pseudonocardia sp. KRD-184]|uniref:Heme exporter protein CcmB n=1 Tax=Pseudonocardia oceani TaxID=2792013 RepID=A0ABS6U2P3_9PSEU|nr:heme exporter protein CcmB [Pseudonocardia oceani]MBW0092465.1 heme exporter protein CcmB [Pseudonocardia oceani]MBW0097105.1 heme exporter protein CcmB [Pseudonocardia oceani]MBW0121946.1 heme exporter protein CcmB [Pseudonocardia oceani]MBW0126500.1 heme exporter protein CcmB [Pseudonocardia oceani]
MTTPLVAPLTQCLALAAKDLRLERRAGEAMLVTAPFGAVALLLAPLAVGTDTPLLRQLGPALYWLVVLLFGVLVTMRASAVDGPAQLAMLRLAGVSPRVRLAGRALANGVLLLGFQLVLAPVAVLLYDPDLTGWPWLLPVFVLVAAGLAVLGALADALAVGLAGRTTLGPLLVAPIAVPLLLGATGVVQATDYGRSPWPWLLLVTTVDLVAALLAAWCARYLEDLA